MTTINFQPDLRPELPLVDGPKEYHEPRALLVRLDDLLSQSGLEGEFFTLSVAHRKIDLSAHSAAEIQSLSRNCTLALRKRSTIHLIDSQLWTLKPSRICEQKPAA